MNGTLRTTLAKRAPLPTILAALFVLLSAQSAGAQSRQTDRDFDGLKGRVKSVTVEDARLDEAAGGPVERERVTSGSVEYDAEGNWTRRKDYDEKGRLITSLAFAFLGGERVARVEEVELPPDALVMERPARRGRRRADPRYSYKLKYVYGPDGKRAQDFWYSNDGRLYMRRVFAYKGRSKTVTVYVERGRLNDRAVYLLDEKGNEVEALLRDTFADKIGYKYEEFDEQGNWTKRIVTRGFKEIPADAFARIKPWSVEYRTITYY